MEKRCAELLHALEAAQAHAQQQQAENETAQAEHKRVLASELEKQTQLYAKCAEMEATFANEHAAQQAATQRIALLEKV